MKKLLKVPLYFAFFVASGMLTAYLTFYLLTSTKSQEVPVLSGKSLLEANKILHEKKLFLKIEGEAYDADVPAGYIMKQEIPSGNRIKEGRTIGVIISRGPKMLYIPMLSGLTMDEAETLIQQNNIRLERVIRIHSSSVEKNRIIAQDPNPEEQGAGGITLVVSAGNYDDSIICPSFSNMPLEEARDLARKIGIDIVTAGDGGIVAAQSPAPHALLKKGDTVRLTLKEGSESKWWL